MKSIMPSSRIRSFALLSTTSVSMSSMSSSTAPRSLAVAERPVAPARVIADYAKKLNGKFEIKGGFMDGKGRRYGHHQCARRDPALPVLQAQVLGTMLAPITSLACVLKRIAERTALPLRRPKPLPSKSGIKQQNKQQSKSGGYYNV